MTGPTALWKVVLLGIIAALLIALGAGLALAPDPSNSVAAYQQATPCTATSVPSDNCYAVVPITVISASSDHLRKAGPEEHVIVQAPSGPGEIDLPWQSEQDQVLLAGTTGTVDLYRGAPVNLSVAGYHFATLQNPVVAKAQTRWDGWILLGLGLLFGGVVVFQLVTTRHRESVPVPSLDALRQSITELSPNLDPQLVERMKKTEQILARMQAQPLRGRVPTRGQTIGIIIGCAVAVFGALALRGPH